MPQPQPKSPLKLHQRALWCVLGINVFEGLDAPTLEALNRQTHTKRYRRGETIYFPGDPTNVYFLKSGRVKLVYVSPAGRKLTLAICRPGQPFGELDDKAQTGHRLMAVALTDVELCWLPRDTLLQLAQDHPQLGVRLVKWVGEQAREIQTRLEELLFVDVPTRLMRLLLRLADEYGQVTPDGLLIDLPLTHQEVAELIGSTRETTSLAINQLQKQGLLERRSKRFLLPDPDALRGHLSRSS